MLYVYYGNDAAARQKACRAFFESAQWEERKHSIENDIGIRVDEFRSLVENMSLFGEKTIVLLENVFANAPAKEYILSNIEKIQDSETVCILSEETLLSGEKETLKKHAEKIEEYALGKQKKKE